MSPKKKKKGKTLQFCSICGVSTYQAKKIKGKWYCSSHAKIMKKKYR